MTEQTIQKYLQQVGFDSRRNIRQWIHAGSFKVNGKVVADPNFPVDGTKDSIFFNNKKLDLRRQKKSYYIFHKPVGVVSTLSDPQGRPTIKEFITKIPERVYPVGRLDFHSEGLILLTNDGELMNFVITPANKIPKIYVIKVKGMLSPQTQNKLETKGMFIDGIRARPLKVEYIKKTAQGNSWWRIKLTEGKKHIVRKIFKYAGHPVEKLKRMTIGTIQLKKLPAGHWKELSEAEVITFKRKCGFQDKA